MKSFNQYITERPSKITVDLGGFRSKISEIRGLINPTFSELTGFIKNTQFGVRFLVSEKKDLYVWDGAKIIHADVARGENIIDNIETKTEDLYLKGSITYDKFSEPNVYAVMAIQGGKKYANKMAKRHPVFKELLALPELKVVLYR